ncbi:MAG: hypothetical protein KY429_01620 [Actinobacteria bacterium]|nr:hypothetical protein [Actinomycetota bacterium]
MAAVLFTFFARLGVGYFKEATRPVVQDEPAEDVPTSISLTYVCDMCGLELAVVKVAKEKGPKHCGEEMRLVVERD